METLLIFTFSMRNMVIGKLDVLGIIDFLLIHNVLNFISIILCSVVSVLLKELRIVEISLSFFVSSSDLEIELVDWFDTFWDIFLCCLGHNRCCNPPNVLSVPIPHSTISNLEILFLSLDTDSVVLGVQAGQQRRT